MYVKIVICLSVFDRGLWECMHVCTTRCEGHLTSTWFLFCFCFFFLRQDVMEEYRKTGRHMNHGMELVVEMLTTGYWPAQSGPKCSLPKQVVKCCKEFEEFYLQKNTVSGKREREGGGGSEGEGGRERCIREKEREREIVDLFVAQSLVSQLFCLSVCLVLSKKGIYCRATGEYQLVVECSVVFVCRFCRQDAVFCCSTILYRIL